MFARSSIRFGARLGQKPQYFSLNRTQPLFVKGKSFGSPVVSKSIGDQIRSNSIRFYCTQNNNQEKTVSKEEVIQVEHSREREPVGTHLFFVSGC